MIAGMTTAVARDQAIRQGGLPQTRGGRPAPVPAPQSQQAAPPSTATTSAVGITPGQNTAAPGIPGANDPSYLAYMRQMGVDEANLNILTGHRVNSLTRQLGRALPVYAEKKEVAMRDTGSSFEDRGMFRSGGRMVAQADVGRAVDRERLDYEAGIRDQIMELYLTNGMDVAAIRRDLMEQGLSAAAANAIINAEAGLQ
jgi:hypothetical protein